MVSAKKAEKRRKPGPKGLGDRRNFTIRISPELVDEFDKIARQYSISRTQLVTRLMENMVAERERMEGDLFKGWSESLDVVLERVLREVVRDERGPVLDRLAKLRSKRKG